MNLAVRATLPLFLLLLQCAPLRVPGATIEPLKYTLTAPSTFANDCLPCGRPLLLNYLRGTFSLIPSTNSTFQITNIDWIAYRGTNVTYRIRGGGSVTLSQGASSAATQMRLILMVDNGTTNETVTLTNNVPDTAATAWPAVDIGLTEKAATLFRVYEARLLAYPIQDLWFSGGKPLPGSGVGDLVSYGSTETILFSKDLRTLPPGNRIDALTPSTNGEVYFSLAQDFTNSSGAVIHHGDLLSNSGAIIATNPQLLQNFQRAPSVEDAGLDAVFVNPDGKIFFSISKAQFSGTAGSISPGDILSTDGSIVRKGAQLIQRFQPTQTGVDPGLDAFYIWPSGEVWFSTDQGFDSQIGPISAGDILSDKGYIVFSHADLILPFSSADQSLDYGLTAFYLVSDFVTSATPPVFTSARFGTGTGTLNWRASGKVFKLESASAIGAPFLDDGSWIIGSGATRTVGGPTRLYRLRQW